MHYFNIDCDSSSSSSNTLYTHISVCILCHAMHPDGYQINYTYCEQIVLAVITCLFLCYVYACDSCHNNGSIQHWRADNNQCSNW